MTLENRLRFEKSPYLLQHKNNPVDWYAWGEEAFEKARREGKLIFLSIGYSTCHWCHVMEHDSFEKQEVADILNKHYVSIKVDREERPDVDHLYMSAVMAMTGGGGWPLSVFLTPDLKPFFGGTFFWKDQFKQVLLQIQNLWVHDPEKIKSSGEELVGHLSDAQQKRSEGGLDEGILQSVFQIYQQSFDSTFGGFGQAPKFPRSTDLSLLLRIHRRRSDKEALEMAEKTLEMMARGGMYDHLGGGFHRYATDNRWMIPHFEKMLYDNALLAWTYLEAYQVTQKEMYASVAREILDYVLSDMTSPEGGFYSAEDADSEGEEGKFYVWTEDELKNVLTVEEFEKFSAVYGTTSEGNFEHGTNILHLYRDFNWSAKKDPLIQTASQKLSAFRKKRIHPHKDDKILTSWNGLMIVAFSKGYQVLDEEEYLKSAQKAAQFIRKNLFVDGRLLRRYREGESRFSGFLEDYSFLIHGLIDLYQSDFNSQWLEWALELQSRQDELFWDPQGGGYFFADQSAKDLYLRKKETYDGATPSGNSVSLLNLVRLFGFAGKVDYYQRAQELLKFLSDDIRRYPAGYSMALIGYDYMSDNSVTICEGNVCRKPESDLERIQQLLKRDQKK